MKISSSKSCYSINKISFRILSPEEIKKVSVANINTKSLYDVVSRKPNTGGALDLRLGVANKTNICKTCNESIQTCAGHYGHITLALPVFHIGLLKNTISILNCICKTCSAVLLPFHKKIYYKNNMNINAIKAECKKAKTCPKCNAPNGVVKKNTGFRIYHEIKSHKESQFYEINPITCQNLFRLIQKDDYEYLGIRETPENLIIQELIVPPACIRPSVDMMEQGFNEDDLTVKLSEIVNTSNLLDESIRKGNSTAIINDDWDMLQLQVSLLINSDVPSVNMQYTPIRGIVQRLKGKNGRFRCNLSGKRVDFTGRTVISPDPNLGVEEVGIPEQIAQILTVPEKVTETNLAFLTGLVQNGMSYPGANYIISPDGKGGQFKRFLMYSKNNELKIGDIVERHLMNGDIVLFNRQPSLHRMSIMSHRVKVHKHRTFRFNECVCAPYNADFDGDEMNIHVPQTVESRAEAVELMGIKNNICTPKNNEPLISCTQDFLTGAYFLTARDVFFDRNRFSQLCMYAVCNLTCRITAKPAILQPVELFTGKQVIEYVIDYSLNESAMATHSVQNADAKKQVNLNAKNRNYLSDLDPNDGHVLIVNGRYLKGRIDKAIIGGENRKGSLIYRLLKVSRRAAVTAMNCLSRLTSRYLMERGFSIGLDDVFPSKELVDEKNTIVSDGYDKVNQLLDENSDIIEDETNPKRPEIEMKISSILSRIRDDCGNSCVAKLGRSNSPVVMQMCGSKGSKINVSQMVACVGQQIISGSRILYGMYRRTLPHFKKGCMGAESRGFVVNSFFTGLRSYECFFHAVSGREGLVDTAVKTAETGYMQRRLMKALEDLSVQYDHTVRNSHNDLVQIRYGEDGVQPLEDEGAEKFERIFASAKLKFSEMTSSVTSSTDEMICDLFTELRKINSLREIANGMLFSDLQDFIAETENESYYHGGRTRFYWENPSFASSFFSELKNELLRNPVEPGTAVGAIASQSIGEPGTQMTLKTFHFAGVASMNITLGVPRLKEIINGTLNISTPIINAQLLPSDTISGLENALIIKGRIESVRVEDLCRSITTAISEDGLVLSFEIDEDLMQRMHLEVTIEQIKAAVQQALKTPMLVDASGNVLRYTVKRLKENVLFSLERVKKQVLSTKITGFDETHHVVANKKTDCEDGYELLIEGTGFAKVLNVPGVDPLCTVSNNILEVFKSLGIEAARTLIVKEIEYTMGKHGITVDLRHVMLLSDMMCYKGMVLGITRFGISKMRSSTLMLASFEQTADYLFNAAVEGKSDEISGVSESIIMGVPVSLGSGMIELYWDDKKIVNGVN